MDPDGEPVAKPVRYKFKLFSLDDPGNVSWLVDPDSLRRRDAPGGFADWDSSGRDSTSAHYTNLTIGRTFIFALVAYDQAGAYSPVFSLDENMVQFQITTAAASGAVEGPRHV